MKKSYILSKRGMLSILFLLSVHLVTFAQTIHVTGSVTDLNGDLLPGVNIAIVGTVSGTISDFNGNYAIDAPANAKLRFSFIGQQDKVVDVNSQKVINVVLQPSYNSLDEVVVVGYGQMKKTDVTGSMVSVSNDAITKSVSTSLDQALQGHAAGVQIQQNNGTPGGSSSIRIRGINSLTGSNEPIFVIDGMIIDGSTGSGNTNALSSINPSDILTMDVLKDASATAIYGSRGANGVIIITTKRGEESKANVSYDGYMGWQEMPKKLDLLDLHDYATLHNTRASLNLVNRDARFIRTDLLGKGTDWQDELFGKAMMQSHNLSITGGAKNSSYALGAGYLDQKGIAIGSGFTRFSLRGSFDSQVKDYLKVGVNFALSTTKQMTTVNDASLIAIALKQTPDVAVRNAEGTFDGPSTSEYVQSNPVGMALLKDNRNQNTGIRSNLYMEAKIIDGLTLRSEYSLDYGFGNQYTFNPSYTFGALVNDVREGTRTKSYSNNYNWKNVLNYNKTFGVHNINVMLGQELQRNAWENLYGYRTGFLTNGSTDLNAGDGTTARNSNGSSANSISSQFGRVFYSFDDKYLLTATLRHDGSSKFDKDNRWGWFPSAALAWKVSSESFLKDNPVINNLKLRAGWGAVGNQNVANYAYTATYAASATNWGTGLLASNTPNKLLQWETTSSSNLGLDLNLFDNRIEIIADVYYKKTKNLLLRPSLPSYVGTSGVGSTTAPWMNIGSLENKGFELSVNTVNFDASNFTWRSNFVFSLNRNKVLALDTETSVIDKTIQQGSDVAPVTRTSVGHPVGEMYGYKVIGRFEKATDFYYRDTQGNVVPTALPKNMTIEENGAWIGDYIFEDVNKDGVIDEQDRTKIGNPEPKFTFGIGNTFSYKGIELNVFLSGSYGNQVVNYQRRWLENPRENTNLLQTAMGYAQLALIDPNKPNDFRNVKIVAGDPYMPRIAGSSLASASNFRFSDKFVEDGSYLRIQSISLGYNLPENWTKQLGIKNLKVYSNLQNVFTFTKYSGYDPEIGSLNQDALITGFDNARYPSPRIYTFGINATF